MDKAYWIGRNRAARAMARAASTGEARLIHYELAGRHSIKAAECAAAMAPQAAADGARSVLHLPGLWPAPPSRAERPSAEARSSEGETQ